MITTNKFLLYGVVDWSDTDLKNVLLDLNLVREMVT